METEEKLKFLEEIARFFVDSSLSLQVLGSKLVIFFDSTPITTVVFSGTTIDKGIVIRAHNEMNRLEEARVERDTKELKELLEKYPEEARKILDSGSSDG